MKQILINNLLWDVENYSKNEEHFWSFHEAYNHVKRSKRRLPTPEELEALFLIGSTWDSNINGRWVAGNHDSDHQNSLFFPARDLDVSAAYWTCRRVSDSFSVPEALYFDAKESIKIYDFSFTPDYWPLSVRYVMDT